MLEALACGDPMEQIAALMARAFREDRKNARESAQLEERHIMAEGRKRVKAMRDEADATRTEAIMRGGAKILGGSMQIEAQVQECSDLVGDEVDEDEYTNVMNGAAKAMDGIGDIAAGGYKADAAEHRADAVEHQSLEAAAERRADQYRNQMNDAQEMLRKISEFLQDVKSAQEGAKRAAILRA